MLIDAIRVYVVFNLLLQTALFISEPNVVSGALAALAVYFCDLAFNESRI